MADAARELIFVGIRGAVLALKRSTGEIAWETELKGNDFVNLTLDGDDLLASGRGEVWCLDPQTGALRWSNPLRGYGYGLVTFARGSNAAAAVAQMESDAEQARASATIGGGHNTGSE